jgi:perosamine synthetase
LIEDSCEALGADVRGQKAGSFGEAGLFAFYPNKQITA